MAISQQGWRRRGLAALLGVCATAALPPFYVLPLLIPAFAGLFLLVQSAPTRRQAFWDGWWWGLGHFTTGLYWICISLYVDPIRFAWLTPFALFGLPSVLAIYVALVTLGVHAARCRAEYKILLFALLWCVSEYARAHLFTGFPWNLIGYVWTASDATLQMASVVGIYGLSWLTVLLAAMPALFVLKLSSARAANIANAILLVAMIGFGAWRLDANPTQYTQTKIRVVQGNIAESMKHDSSKELEGLKKYATLTRSLGLDTVNAVVWPETAVEYIVVPNSPLTHDLGNMLPKDAVLLTGALREEGDEKNWQIWNSFFEIDHEGKILAQYDKHHLVPFGEFIPFRNLLPINNIVGSSKDFSRGSGPQTLMSAPLLPYSPLICYEAIFPSESQNGTGEAQWMVNVTNDAWFGTSSGPYQHLEMVRMRAVEQGLPLVRAANTGISAVFDPLGRELGKISLNTAGVLDMNQPKAFQGNIILSRYPYAPILFISVLTGLFGLLFQKGSRKSL